MTTDSATEAILKRQVAMWRQLAHRYLVIIIVQCTVLVAIGVINLLR